MDRWKMNKLGFLNFWYYDQEEFPLHSGHLLLRGNNGAGKSITTQSFIPFLLDGDRRPERLDAFGTRDKKMEFYLLGEGENEKDESTGYLYLEFKRERQEEYLTIGVGMRARQGGKLEFWGFCLCDGRRIGPDGLCLYEMSGDHLLPLTKKKLENRIGIPEHFVEKPEDYKRLVNNKLFHFRDIRQYEQLVQLLINVRAPKLSKDFRPTLVKQILHDSLQVLTEEDLSAMANTFQNLDELRDTLKQHKAMVQSAQIILNEYQRYNQLVLGRKAQAWLDTRAKALRAEQQHKDAQALQDELAAKLSEQETREEQSGLLLAQARAQRAALGEDDLSAKRATLEQLRAGCGRLAQQLRDAESQLLHIRDDIAGRELRVRELARKLEDSRVRLRQDLDELERENTLLALGDPHEAYLRAWNAGGRYGAEQDAVFAALQRRKAQIKEVLRCLEQIERAKADYDTACRLLDEADAARNRLLGELRDAEQLEQNERDKLLSGFVEWQAANTHLRFGPLQWQSVRRALYEYRSSADWGAACAPVDACMRRTESIFGEKRLQAEYLLRELDGQLKEKRQKLAQLQNQPEPVPPRKDAVQAARARLALLGIPCAAFYETVDFAPALSEEERSLLEAQLSDAGILDALVVPHEHLDQVRGLMEEYPDRFLLPGPEVEYPLNALVPEGPFREQAAACLRSISVTDMDAQAALLPDGQFRNGILRGRSHAEAPAGYVGAAARKRNRERQLLALQEEIAALEAQRGSAGQDAARWQTALEQLREERERMPSAENLDHALAILSAAQKAEEEAAKELDRRQAEERRVYQEKARLDQECRVLGTGLPYARDIPAYEEAYTAAEDYQLTLLRIEKGRVGLEADTEKLSDTEEELDKRREDEAATRKLAGNARESLEINQAQADEVQAFLDRPENRERAQRLEMLTQEIRRQDAENRDAGQQRATLREQLKSVKEDIRRLGDEVLDALENEQAARTYFEEDLALGFSALELENGLERCAREASAGIRQTDQARTPEQVQESLWKTYQQHNNELLRYHPDMKTIFDPSEKPFLLRQRQCITLRVNDQELSLAAAIQALQDKITMTEGLIEDGDRELFEEILTETISNKLRARIQESQRWTQDMTELMKTLRTSMGLTFALEWRPKRAEGEGELDTEQLVRLLNRDPSLLSPSDRQKIPAHFLAKVRQAQAEAALKNEPASYTELIPHVLDYRNWFEFQMFYRREGEPRKELTDRVFNRFSGGEKAMAMYVPLFASVSAQYQKGGSDCPQLLALDEAFAGVDDRNIGAMFELVQRLDFDYIMNSQALWGCYACVSDLDIAELHRPDNASVVAILRYYWNGSHKLLEEDV